MDWTDEAKQAVSRVPFFVRKRVEEEAGRFGAKTVAVEHVRTCQQRFLKNMEEEGRPLLEASRCLTCGQCVRVCPTGTLSEGKKGYRILVGGKLGRHPRLGEELPRIYAPDETLGMLDRCLDLYQQC